MAIFLHPFLTRGVVRIANSAFPITRGRVELPDEVGEPLGWRKIEDDDSAEGTAGRRASSLTDTRDRR